MAGKSDSTTAILRELRQIPGVGPSVAQDLYALGVRSIPDLVGRDPQQMYEHSCELQGATIDRCLLYVYRCAVYYASTAKPKPNLLKWWNWKDAISSRKQKRQA